MDKQNIIHLDNCFFRKFFSKYSAENLFFTFHNLTNTNFIHDYLPSPNLSTKINSFLP